MRQIKRDRNGSGKVDLIETFQTKNGESNLIQRQEDQNGDGEMDLTLSYRNGKLFRREGHETLHRNLYIFLRAQILVDEDFGDGKHLTEQARKHMEKLDAPVPLHFDPPEKPLETPIKADESRDDNTPATAPRAGRRGRTRTAALERPRPLRKKRRGWFE